LGVELGDASSTHYEKSTPDFTAISNAGAKSSVVLTS
jgi:hypothetical protein